MQAEWSREKGGVKQCRRVLSCLNDLPRVIKKASTLTGIRGNMIESNAKSRDSPYKGGRCEVWISKRAEQCWGIDLQKLLYLSWLRLWLMQVAENLRTDARTERDSHRGFETNACRLIFFPRLTLSPESPYVSTERPLEAISRGASVKSF